MTNQLNFGNKIVSFSEERMIRISPQDNELLITGEKTMLFGTNPKNNIEIWFYFPDGVFAGSIRLDVEDVDLGLSTTVDNTGAFEYINVNLENIAERIELDPGRYTVSVYFFRDEMSSKDDENKLLIKEISPSRTEVKLSFVDDTADVIDQVYEFVVPSVPRLHAKGLIDQTFNESTDFIEPGEFIGIPVITNNLNESFSNTTERINRSGANDSYLSLVSEILDRTYIRSLDNLANDYTNLNVQEVELRKHIIDALDTTLLEIEDKKELDPRFQFI